MIKETNCHVVISNELHSCLKLYSIVKKKKLSSLIEDLIQENEGFKLFKANLKSIEPN